MLSSIKAFIIRFIPSFFLILVNSCSISFFFLGSTLAEVALSSRFEVGSSFTMLLTRRVRLLPSSPDLTNPIPMTLILRTFGVLELLTLISRLPSF